MRHLLATGGMIAALLGNATAPAAAQDGLVTHRVLSPEQALQAAEAALKTCREAGYQIAVAVVDRAGHPQVVLRDRFAGLHTPEVAQRKAWTAVSFRTDTLDLESKLAAGTLAAGIARFPNVIMVGGGVKIESAGATVGGIGVSGAPSGAADDACARVGVDELFDVLNF